VVGVWFGNCELAGGSCALPVLVNDGVFCETGDFERAVEIY